MKAIVLILSMLFSLNSFAQKDFMTHKKHGKITYKCNTDTKICGSYDFKVYKKKFNENTLVLFKEYKGVSRQEVLKALKALEERLQSFRGKYQNILGDNYIQGSWATVALSQMVSPAFYLTVPLGVAYDILKLPFIAVADLLEGLNIASKRSKIKRIQKRIRKGKKIRPIRFLGELNYKDSAFEFTRRLPRK